MGKAPCCDKANVKKGPWSPEEDSKLKDYIEKYGTGGNWIAFPKKAGLKRCGKSCRLRWFNYLRPNIKHGEFSDEEDGIICSLFASIGSRWSIIAAQLPGRTDNDIKNYWNTKLKKKLMAMAPSQSQRRSLPFSSLHRHQNPTLSSQISRLSPYKDSSSCSNYPYYPTSTIKPAFNGFEPISSIPSSLLCNSSNNKNNPSTNSTSSIFQTQEGLVNPMQYFHHNQAKENHNLLVFGSEASCSSNSDGSCSQMSYDREIKQEDMGFQNYISNGYQENQKFMLSNGDHHDNLNQTNGYFGEIETQTPLDYLEDGKQMISSSSSNNNNNNDNNNFLLIDENKTQKEKLMYYYYY